ncbi:NACHT domain-containing protein [uncultured Roseivirga sp.]|uniref:NACHT domain-containing protein n=1 Tax=uncultured Roseivirga sp. TaxID=543088 RepID=UPI0030DBE759
MEEFNINEVIGSFLSHKADDIQSIGKSTFKKFSTELSLKLKSKYSVYLKNLTDRYGKTRSFFIRDNPKPLYQFYEPIGVENENKVLEKANILDLVSTHDKLIILGSGGAGKSILLKHLLLDSLRSSYKVPIFIELRDSNHKNQKLIDLLSFALKEFELNIDSEYLHRALQEGHFIVFLDGLDEVKSSLRMDLIKEIEEFTKLYDSCSFVISSRPDDNISEFEQFSFYRTLPLTLEQSVSLVKKLPAEEELNHYALKVHRFGGD